MKTKRILLMASLGCALFASRQSGCAASVNINVAADTFINSGSPGNNDGANGWFDAGTDGLGGVRRGLFRFDLSSIVPGSIITSAAVHLTVSRNSISGPIDSIFDLFRMNTGWNEGVQTGNSGAPAVAGESTWTSAMQGTADWSAPGARGNAAPSASSSTAVAGVGGYSFSGDGLTADVQYWVNNPSANHGWMLASESESTLRTVRGFASRENGSGAALLAVGFAPPITSATFSQHNLISDIPGEADQTDPNLVNPWGIAFSATGPFWFSDNHSGVSTLYDSTGAPQPLVVTVPPPAGGTPPGAPTGIIFNSTADFAVSPGVPSRFIFATEDGTIIAWNAGTNAVLKADNSASGAVYKGLAQGSSGGSNLLYAANFHAGQVDIFDSKYNLVTWAGAFVDPDIPAGFAPFNVQNFAGQLYVTYAKQDADAHDDVPGPGNGYVDVFDTAGHLVKRLASGGALDSPWGLAMAPVGFGAFGGTLLIGNFGDGAINAFNPATGALMGSLLDASGNPIAIEGLWGLAFGNGGKGGDSHTLYFTAGIPGDGSIEDHGLFGSISAALPSITGIVDQGIAVKINWAGGTGPFLLQKKTSLSEAWWNVLTTSNRTVTVAKDADTGFYRMVNQAQTTVMPFTVMLSGAAQVPVVDTPATGEGMLSIEGNTLTYHISYKGLSAPAAAAHIHGPADATTSAGVIIPFSNISGTSGTISGTATLTDAQMQYITNGLTYVNIHDALHGGGEIRGQVVPLQLTAKLNGASEVPAVNTPATGLASLTMIGNDVIYQVTYTGLAGAATASHIHGPADATHASGVLVPLNDPSGTSGVISGTVSLTPSTLADVLAGLTYINIHTTTNAGGEIRGQITR